MTGNYSHLDTINTPSKFRLPPIPTGMYEVTDDFDCTHDYHFRRMPRARKYTGRFGLWYHHPDAHWILVGWVSDQGHFQRPVELLNEYERFLSLFLLGKRTLIEPRCEWCGKSGHTFPKSSCEEKSKTG